MIYLKQTILATKQEQKIEEDGTITTIDVPDYAKYIFVFVEDYIIKDKLGNDVTMSKEVYRGTRHKLQVDKLFRQQLLDAIDFKISLLPELPEGCDDEGVCTMC